MIKKLVLREDLVKCYQIKMDRKSTTNFSHQSRDVVYVATNDDVAAIIESIKNSNRSLVYLVSPKRAEVLTSIVNLKLIVVAADEIHKKIVIVTTNVTTTKLAGQLQIPVAINLQATPKVPAVTNQAKAKKTSLDEPIEIELPESFVKKQKNYKRSKSNNAPVILKKTKSSRNPRPKKNRQWVMPKHLIPFAGIVLSLVAVVGGLWYLGTVEGQATVRVTTSLKKLEGTLVVNLSDSAKEPISNPAIIPVETKTIETTIESEIVATGKETKGDKAEFIVNVLNCKTAQMVVPAQTTFSRNGAQFVSLESAVIPGTSSAGCGYDGDNVKSIKVQAKKIGNQYNVGTGDFKVSNFSTNSYTATASKQTKRGRLEVVSVITQVDIDKSKRILKTKRDDQQVEEELKTSLIKSDWRPLEETVEIEAGEIDVNVRVGQEAKSGKISQTIVYRQKGVRMADIDQLMRPLLNQQVPDLEILDSGLSSAILTTSQNPIEEDQFQLTVQVFEAQASQALDHDQIWGLIQEKTAAKAAAQLRQLSAVETVNVVLSPKWAIWVTTIPDERDRVEIEINGLTE